MPKLDVITQELKDALFADPDKTIPLPSGEPKKSGGIPTGTSVDGEIDDFFSLPDTISTIKLPTTDIDKYDKEMFVSEDRLIVVSKAMFLLQYHLWYKACEGAVKADFELAKLKKKCWQILELNISLDVYNTIKSKSEFKTKVQVNDCVWLKNTLKQILLTETIGIPSEDKIQTGSNLMTCRQSSGAC